MKVYTPEMTKEDIERFTIGRVRPSFLAYMNNVSNAVCNHKCIEIGTSTGVNAETMLITSPDITLTVIDPYLNNEHEIPVMQRRIEPFKDRVRFIHDTSVNAAKLFEDRSHDYIYIDGNHDYEFVIDDLHAWYPKVTDYGVLAGHDFNFPSVRKAVLEFAKDIKRMVYGVVDFQPCGSIRAFNQEQMCDWWIWVDKDETI